MPILYLKGLLLCCKLWQQSQVAEDPITEAVAGWCDVDCEAVFKTFKLCIFIIMVLVETRLT